MGLAMMPTMTAAMQAVPREAIPRVSTAMNIIRQGGASIGTAVVTVLLSTAIKDRIPVARVAGGNGFAALQHLTPAQHARIVEPLAASFAHTFVWALLLLAVALVPALVMAFRKDRSPSPAKLPSDVPVALE
jgi:hypothetical protein